jgi:hypothetical protein
MKGPDVASNNGNMWVLLYIGGTPGTTVGQPYKSQQPNLPFSAKYHLRWKADDSYTNAEMYNGTAWVDATWDFTGDVYRSGDYVEMRVPLVDIGSPSTVKVHLCMLNETTGGEWSYAAVPSTSFANGKDPDYTKYYEFDLTGGAAPATYLPLP